MEHHVVDPIVAVDDRRWPSQAALDSVVRSRVLGSDIVRVKIWSPDGRVLYSDEPQLIGGVYILNEDDTAVFASGETDADISDLSKLENRFERGNGRLLEVSGQERGDQMQIGVYGSGYLGTVISACLADFGTPVSCCHPDRSRMVEMAQGNIPFFEKNLKEIIRRNVRAGRLAYSTDIESFARKSQVIFLAEDKPEGLSDIAMRIARMASKPPILTIVTPGPGRHRERARKKHQRRRTAGSHRLAAHVLHRRMRR